MVENKRKKFHDKDKYYRLAKEQGLRSRAAFKLSQINRKFAIFETVQRQQQSSSSSSSAAVILDLCAAPGGWTQIVARTLPKVPIIAVDILPIRAFTPGHRNVTTLIGDITTDQCQANITRTIKSIIQQQQTESSNGRNKKSDTNQMKATCSLVLHDGAPNVGADYAKDAYVQNEIALAALKCATQHLCVGGTFVTKVYRSRDYSAYYWTISQLFTTVTAFKPTASRNASAEIFLIAQNYKAPAKLDSKFLDPKYVFASIDDINNNVSNDPNNNATSTKTVVGNSKSIFDKSWDKHVRHRSGYDMDHYDATMRHIRPVMDFILGTSSKNNDDDDNNNNQSSSSSSMKDAIQLLSSCTGLSFHCPICRPTPTAGSLPVNNNKQCYCQFVLQHPFTTTEMKEHCTDLRVLNKTDFKSMFTWRTKIQNAIAAKKEMEQNDENSIDDDDDDDDDDSKNTDNKSRKSQMSESIRKAEKGSDNDEDDEDDEEMIAKEMEEVRLRRQRERKRQKKKEHELMQKRRKKAALSGNMINMDITNGEAIFSLATIPNAKALEAIREVNLDRITDDDLMINYETKPDDDMVIIGGNGTTLEKNADGTYQNNDDDDDDDDNNSVRQREKQMQRELELEEGYIQYLQSTKNKDNVVGTKLAKRSKKLIRQNVVNEIQEDIEMAQINNHTSSASYDAKAYAKLLSRGGNGNDSDDDDDDDDDENHDDEESDSDDGYNDIHMTPEESANSRKNNNKKMKLSNDDGHDDNSNINDTTNPLLHQFDIQETKSVKTARWFSNPLFATIGQSVSDMTTINPVTNKKKEGDNSDDENNEFDDMSDDDDENDSPRQLQSTKRKSEMNKKRKATVEALAEKESTLTADDILASIPKTDKQIRHEKRLKVMERDERKRIQREKKSGSFDGNNEIQMVASSTKNRTTKKSSNNDDDSDSDMEDATLHLIASQKAKVLEARKLIKAGFGNIGMDALAETKSSKSKNNNNDNAKIEFVAQTDVATTGNDRLLPIMDDRIYDSEHEDYDSDDQAKTLALGTMILRRSKEKAFVDASYNRYAWNDPSDLPEWFVDDENKHYRPQLPIPPALLAKMKEKMIALSSKPIAKVAEARARKNRRAQMKLAAAKKQAEAVANSNDMTEAMKLKAISKALTSGKSDSSKKGSGKKYVVAKKGRGNIHGVKGAKVVDKRLKKEKRALDRIDKTKKQGKKNGLTGSKKRRNHK